jgi:TonB family protein
MKTSLVPLLAVSLLLVGCSTSTSTVSYPNTSPAVVKDTRWGRLPSYERVGSLMSGLRSSHPSVVENAGNALKLDLLVNPDGSVREVAIRESSRNPSLDRAVAAAFDNARYTLEHTSVDSTPYVVRLTLEYPGVVRASTPRAGHVLDLRGQGPRPDYSGPPISYSYSSSDP